ncbi:MAG: VIT family protein [Propionibacterium sp.]
MASEDEQKTLGMSVARWQQVEESQRSSAAKLNWLRAGVLGANDGIVSTAGLVMGVAGANAQRADILVAGVAGLVSGALSMGAGEYVSVSTQRDSERAMLGKERVELATDPVGELAELTGLYQKKGLSADLAHKVAVELTAHNALDAHAEVELGIDMDELASPWQAAGASIVSFSVGALVPLVFILFVPGSARIAATVFAVGLALAVTGIVSSRLGRSPSRAATIRNVVGGFVAMAVTYGIGHLVGVGLR